ncbi:MAG: hypothetical protein BWK78_06665 [Thiotrichaceae bacterium IS1]|nr:MAG: hypothetical protein BWK78_06665 [Thiotrichaceae bacterium IS1]
MSLPTIAFLTALPLEFKEVKQHLENPYPETIDGRTYTIDEKEKWRIVLRQQHSQGNYQAARETDWLIQHFQPTYLFFIGVAGGIKDVELGNVVVATFARGYESIKVKDGETYPRLPVEYSAHSLVEQATELARNWQVTTLVCPIASGERLVSDEQFLKELKQLCNDAVAVEMEAIGFLGSIRQHENVKGIVIRGISDLVVGKNAEGDVYWQPIAARNAAAFAFAMLGKLPRHFEEHGIELTQLEVNSFELGYLMLLLCVMPEDELLMLRTQNIINQIVGLNISPNEITCDNLPLVIRQKVLPKLAAENLKAARWLMLSNNFFASMKAVDAGGVRDFTSLNEFTRTLLVDNNLREEVSKKLILASDSNVSSHDSMNYLLDCMNIIRSFIMGKVVNN